MEGILSKLDPYTKAWASKLTEDDMAKLLQGIYQLPGLIEALCIKSEKSANIGKYGEHKFSEICQKLPGNYTIQDTSKQGKMGDFIINYSNNGVVKKVLVDIKNYSITVPKKEIEKFHEDITYGSYDAGLMISYNTKFVGIAEHIFIDDVCLPTGKIPIMYLSTKDESIILTAIELITNKVIVTDQKNMDINSIEILIESINNSLANSAIVRRNLSDLQMTVSKNIQKCQENLMAHEMVVKKSIKEMSKYISKIMVDDLTKIAPKIESRIDNIDEKILSNSSNFDNTSNFSNSSIFDNSHSGLQKLSKRPVSIHDMLRNNKNTSHSIPHKTFIEELHSDEIDLSSHNNVADDLYSSIEFNSQEQDSINEDYILLKIKGSDRSIVRKLLNLTWTKTEYDEKNNISELIFEDKISITIQGFKGITFVKVIINPCFDKISERELLKYMVKDKNNIYKVINFNMEFVEFIESVIISCI